MSIIALWYTGSVKTWQQIQAVNGSIDPEQMYLGQEIRIPRETLTRTDPLTEQFVQKMTRLHDQAEETRARLAEESKTHAHSEFADPDAIVGPLPDGGAENGAASPGGAAADDARDKLFRALVDE